MRLNIGCGSEKEEGWVGIDIIPGSAVDIIAPAWKIPLPTDSIDEIKAEHLVEHLTFYQFNRAIEEWHRLLKPGGVLHIECPDLLELCRRFSEGNHYAQYWTTGAYWPLIYQLYGHQRGRTEEEQLSQVHKSGYTFEHLHFVLRGLGFETIVREDYLKAPPRQAVLRIRGSKRSGP